MAWYEKDKYKECCHNDDCESFDTCIECWDEWAERNPPMTNADHIRSMSDEELAEEMSNRDCPGCPLIDTCTSLTGCRERLLKWLQRPYEGGRE